ncbi:MAG: phenylalanine--tRNA ligase subunit beta, partial [candidate division WOR-3 bacterium]|nr:phenylalanine--tRNA ligase subunit beta [candidate division WOR-3 bacterium]
MKLSYNWLNDFVDLDDINAGELAEILTLKTAETEGIYSVEKHFSGIMSARIEKCEKIDSKYFKCTVKADRDYIVVSGAPNTREGLITFFVKPGGMIDGSEIGRRDIAGTVSEGMLLSGRELGINNDHRGIIELNSIEPGIDIDDIIDFNDHIIEIDNKSLTHRPDLWGIYGFAREAAAILGRNLKDYHVFDISDIDADSDFPIEIRDSELCYRYAGIKIGNIRADESPLNIQARLMRTGHVPRNIIVDLTNYVMTELGQPMHSFDGSKIERIIIDSTEGSTQYTTLDNEERELPSGTLMINSQDGPVAIAGIMGGGNSEINNNSTSLFLESAAFNAGAIRKTSSALGLRTDSSSRFEKSLDPEYALTAALRYILLLSEIQPDIEFRSALTDINFNPFTRNIIKTDTDFIRNTIGARISNEIIIDTLSALGFDTDIDNNKLTVTAPTFRSTKDVSIREDIVEEIARIYGYNEIEASLPAMTLSVPDFNTQRDIAVKIKDILAEQFDMNETDSYIWHDNDFLKQIQYNTTCSIELKNPVSSVNT